MEWYRDFEHCSNDSWWMITIQTDRVLASHWLVIFWIAHPIFGFGLCPYDSHPFNLFYQDITTSVLGFTYVTYIYIIISSEWSVITHFWLPINCFLFPTKRIFHSSESNGWNSETQSDPKSTWQRERRHSFQWCCVWKCATLWLFNIAMV